MVTIYKEVLIPEKITKQISHIECDLCGKKGTYGWKSSMYDLEEVEVRYKTGDSYSEGGYGYEWKYDICPDCFRNKLIPWFESQGVFVQKEWNY